MCFYKSITTGHDTFTVFKVLYAKEKDTGVEVAQVFRRSVTLYAINPSKEDKFHTIELALKEIDHDLEQVMARGNIHFVSDSFIHNYDIPTITDNYEVDPNTFEVDDLTQYPPWYKKNDTYDKIERLAEWTRKFVIPKFKGAIK